jgi:acetoin utilization protein AcuA
LEVAMGTGRFEDKIVLATLYHWHYDLEHSGLSSYAYRRLLERLYGSVGFRVYKTDDPEIAYYPSNSLMARVGPRASPELRAAFEHLLFLESPRPKDLLAAGQPREAQAGGEQ